MRFEILLQLFGTFEKWAPDVLKKNPDQSLPAKDSLVLVMHHGPSDLGSLNLIQIIPKECSTLCFFYLQWYEVLFPLLMSNIQCDFIWENL